MRFTQFFTWGCWGRFFNDFSYICRNERFVEAKRLILCCVVETIFVKSMKIAISRRSAAHLYKGTFSWVRTGNRPFHENAVNNASEWACFFAFFFFHYDEKPDFLTMLKTHQFFHVFAFLKNTLKKVSAEGIFCRTKWKSPFQLLCSPERPLGSVLGSLKFDIYSITRMCCCLETASVENVHFVEAKRSILCFAFYTQC